MIHQPNQPEALIDYADHLQRQLREEVGFLPRIALHEYWQRGQITPAFENNVLAGYLLFYDGRSGNRPRRRPDHLHIHQAAIQYDAQRRMHGTRLVRDLIEHAQHHRFTTIGAWVATDIPANEFWNSIGFQHIASRIGGTKRNRIHNLWIRKLDLHLQPARSQRLLPSPDANNSAQCRF